MTVQHLFQVRSNRDRSPRSVALSAPSMSASSMNKSGRIGQTKGISREREYLLATTGRGNGRWNGGQLEVAQDAGHHRLLGDGGHDVQGAPAAQRTGRPIQINCAAQQPGPIPIRGSRLRVLAVHALLARGGNNRLSQLAMRRQACIAYPVWTRGLTSRVMREPCA